MDGLYFDCFSGAAGDMLLASLLDLGACLEELQEDLARLGLEGLEVRAERTHQGALAGTRFLVRSREADPPRRNYRAICDLLDASSLPEAVRDRSRRIFRRLGEAEARVHGCELEEVHFHEVGAVDSIADVVGFCCVHERLGAPRILCSPLAIGEGFVQTEHGRIPVPAMATLELLRGIPVEMSGIREELVTPTGAAILATLSEGFGRHFAFLPRAIGYGLGTRERSDPPNAVRAVLCQWREQEPAAAARGGVAVETVTLLETNLDDATGQELGRVLELCLAAGALDALALPALMKKGRPGHLLQVLVRPAQADQLEALLLAETPTLGVRRWSATRGVLSRREEKASTSLGPLRVKRVEGPAGEVSLRPEFDELARLARESGRPLAEVRRAIERELDDGQRKLDNAQEGEGSELPPR